MLTVVMTSDEATPFLRQYDVLFQPFVQAGELAFCRWNPQGTDLRSALPELRSLVLGHEHWRALVALPLPAQGAGGQPPEEEHPARRENPFDFLCNAAPDAGQQVEESPVPLIRLAQMLGGVPEPVYDYADVIVKGGEGEYRDTVLQTPREELERQRENWARLEEKYHFPCDKPAELWLLCAQPSDALLAKEKLPAQVRALPAPAVRSFAARNRYPARARFFAMSCARPDHARSREDEFTFWMMVLTLAMNQYEGGRIGPETLYRLTGRVDAAVMQELLSHYINRLGRIDREVARRHALLRARLEDSREQEELPEYSFKVPVEYRNDILPGLTVDEIPVGLAQDCPAPEKTWWRLQMETARRAFRRLLNAPRRALDAACALARRNDTMDAATLCRLDRYQLAELDMVLNDEEIEIFRSNSAGALPVRQFGEQRDRADRAVRTNISYRMKRKTVLAAGSLALAIYLLGFLPELLRAGRVEGAMGTALAAGGVRLGVVAVCGLLGLFAFRSGLINKVRDYNGVVGRIRMQVAASCQFFEGYLSRVCRYMRGRSILNVLAGKELHLQEGMHQIETHRVAIARCCERTRDWMRDFGLDLLPDELQGRAEYFNTAIPPEENEAYDLRAERDGTIRDSCGKQLRVPYPFVSELEIKREDVP